MRSDDHRADGEHRGDETHPERDPSAPGRVLADGLHRRHQSLGQVELLAGGPFGVAEVEEPEAGHQDQQERDQQEEEPERDGPGEHAPGDARVAFVDLERGVYQRGVGPGGHDALGDVGDLTAGAFHPLPGPGHTSGRSVGPSAGIALVIGQRGRRGWIGHVGIFPRPTPPVL